MLSAKAYSFHQKSKLAISLSWIGGYTNVVTFFVLGGAFVSHMTGNTTTFGRELAEQAWAQAEFFGLLIGSFFAGAVASAVMTETARRRGARSKYILPMAAEALLLSIFAGVLAVRGHDQPFEGAARLAMCTLASFTMGLQNATITMISGAYVRTTHVTGVLTDLGLEGVQYMLWFRDRMRRRPGRNGRLLAVSQRHPTILRLALLASIWGSFLLGCVMGTVVYHRLPNIVLIPPVLFVLWILFMDWWQPIADVREIDLLSDPEFKFAGLVHDLLPPSVGIYRLSASRHSANTRAPNFEFWVDMLPDRWRVLILVLSPTIAIDENAASNLAQAVQRLHENGRRLILCGITPRQYATLDKAGVVAQLGWENVSSDVELAISRALEISSREGAARTPV